jgi:hypothetical protein
MPNIHYTKPHLVKTPEGKFYIWEDDDNCDCCRPGDDDQCYVFSEITEAEAELLLKE